ncbi:MAG: acyl carrier protein [Clostridia bacterium]|nr:acyl carrier protein [Clostridia bacterium]
MLLDKVKQLVVDQIGVSADELDMDTNLMNDLEADSLDAVEIIMAMESEFDIEIPDEDAEKFLTIRDMVEYLENTI